MTYHQARNLIIDAYFKENIKPYNSNFCFCGVLAGKDNEWFLLMNYRDEPDSAFIDLSAGVRLSSIRIKHFYLGYEYWLMEDALLSTMMEVLQPEADDKYDVCGECRNGKYDIERHPFYEEALFQGMSKALDVLKSIHESHGEIITDNIPSFNKRKSNDLQASVR